MIDAHPILILVPVLLLCILSFIVAQRNVALHRQLDDLRSERRFGERLDRALKLLEDLAAARGIRADDEAPEAKTPDRKGRNRTQQLQ